MAGERVIGTGLLVLAIVCGIGTLGELLSTVNVDLLFWDEGCGDWQVAPPEGCGGG